MFDELTEELLDLQATVRGQSIAPYARIMACCCLSYFCCSCD